MSLTLTSPIIQEPCDSLLMESGNQPEKKTWAPKAKNEPEKGKKSACQRPVVVKGKYSSFRVKEKGPP